MLKTAHVPPITTTERMPYGILVRPLSLGPASGLLDLLAHGPCTCAPQMLVSPSSAPFAVPKAVVKELEAFPALHRALVAVGSGQGGTARGAGERRATSVGGRW